uniref:Nucleoporin Nup133/Nup155-like N-terminal domain-containing protein n=1 Tax=Clastoptera arizonana TaxID=38151 RepID=A0A1B6E0K1_9HEMI
MNFGPKSVLSPRLSSRSTPVRRTSALQSTFKRTPTKGSISGRSLQSNQIICKSPNYAVEYFGTPLPVLVTEALTFSDSNSAVSVNISNEGWAWFVCGRRLLIWQAFGKRPVSTQCRELALPPSDLAHKAHLVAVYITQSSQMPCCLAVSPEGLVRYWSSIAHESSWIESNADLHGQECDFLQLILPLGCLLVTTTATLVLVTPQISAARHALVCRTIKTPHGWLGGIGRKMSSLIFGSIPSTQIMETKLVKVVARSNEGNIGYGEWNVLVLAGCSLQKWQLHNGETEKLVYEVDLGRPVREAFMEVQIEAQDLVFLDMQGSENKITLLVAITTAQLSSHLYYGLVSFATDSNVPPFTVPITWFYQIRSQDLSPLLNSSSNEKSLQFLMTDQAVLIYNNMHILAVSTISGGDEIELLEPGCGKILGAIMCGRLPVFFTFTNGFVTVISSDIPSFDINTSIPPDLTNISEYGMSDSQLEELSSQKDNAGLMRAAFLLYIRKNLVQSRAMISDLCLSDASLSSRVDAVLDSVIVQVSKDLIDDVPGKDPRWADQKTSTISITSSNSLQIINQLEEKQRVLEWYINFLKDLKLWEQLGGMTIRGKVMATPFILQEHVEKVVAAITLKKMHLDQKFSSLIDTCIEEVLVKNGMHPFGGLTNQDLFYRQVSLIHEVFHQLVKWSENLVYSKQSPQYVISQLITANTILLDMLRAVIDHRYQSSPLYKPSSQLNIVLEYLPWTSGSNTFREALVTQMKLTLEHGVRATGDLGHKAELLDQLVIFVDILLDGRKMHVESLRNTTQFNIVLQQYETDRINLIQPFLVEEEYDRAAMLAEKYLEFQILIEICDKTNNQHRLDQYTEKFKEQNFSQFLFNWYMRENKQSHLVGRCHEKGGEQLAQLLGEHPSLSWLNDIATGNYKRASTTLVSLAENETQLLRRKKSMISFAALALLAANDEPKKSELEELKSSMNLIVNQEELPDSILNAYGYDFDSLRVFTPAELIKLYICDENPTCTEFDMKKALDLLSYIHDDLEKCELRNEIWCKAITKDTWVDLDPNAPLGATQQLMFFKLVNLCILLDSNLDQVPSLEQLSVADELGDLKDNNTFQYLLRVGYEHVIQDVQ